MAMTKPSASKPTGGASKTAGPANQYLKKGGKVGKKKMMTGGMNNPNADATVNPTKKMGGMYKKGGKTGMKKGM